MAKFSLNFDGFLDLAYEVDKLQDGGLKEATDNALQASYDYLQPQIKVAMEKAIIGPRAGTGKLHKINWEHTGKTKSKLYSNAKVEWEGTKASIGIGFEDTPVPIILALGTPHMIGDDNLYRALKGKGKHKKNIEEAQKKAFDEVIKKYMEG